ncbi:hypothetical protein SUBVAR_05557 [Subdoligranulum variabile DSM 15176]|uniref:Uncharacterized protein n=1 Tax=Subdoligranulum variabile DSM 15176 TaxID=411471 RepID=D1PMJ7_9FIRM|nr:hypothetical protein SUBVAR_05557 [Subdoligranulum variabile DSM 15176]
MRWILQNWKIQSWGFQFLGNLFLWHLKDLVITVDDSSFGISNLYTDQIPVPHQFIQAATHTVDTVSAETGQTAQAIIPVVRIGKHIGQQSFCFQRQTGLPRMDVAHNSKVAALRHTKNRHKTLSCRVTYGGYWGPVFGTLFA